MIKWVVREVNGGNDGIAQIRDDAAGKGVKLGDLDDKTQLLIPRRDLLTPVELRIFYDSGWVLCKTSAGLIFFPSSNGKGENWIEEANVRVVPTPSPASSVKHFKVTIVADVTVEETK